MSRVLVLGCPLILSRLIETRLQLNMQTFPRRPPRVSWVRGTPVFFVGQAFLLAIDIPIEILSQS